MIYCDAHCHLGSRQFDEDREQMLERMMENKVKKAIVICCSRHDLEYGIRLREMNPDFRLAMAIHPQDLEDDHDETRLERFVRIAEETKPDMIGETGLDYYSHPHTKDHQQHFFIEQLKLAQKLKLPVDIHSRKASNDTLQILKQYPVQGIIHSYSGSIEMARLYMKEGFYISFGASVLFKDAKKPKEVVKEMPLDRLLIETDAPYQSPIKDKRHEPADVVRIYEAIAEIKKLPLEELCKAVEYNFDKVFSS